MSQPVYCDRHPTARAQVTDAVFGLNLCGHCATTHGEKLVLTPLNTETEAVAK